MRPDSQITIPCDARPDTRCDAERRTSQRGRDSMKSLRLVAAGHAVRARLVAAIGLASVALTVSVAAAPSASAYLMTSWLGWIGWDGCVRADELFASQCYNSGEWGIERPQALAVSP